MLISVRFPVNRFHPIIAPTIACVVDTGSENFVIRYTVAPAASATVNDPPSAFTAPSFPSVTEAPDPCSTAPSMTKIEAIIAAFLKLIIFEPTAEPNILEASFAPSDHPRKSPLVRKRRIITLLS